MLKIINVYKKSGVLHASSFPLNISTVELRTPQRRTRLEQKPPPLSLTGFLR
jgi:hypothetical protein